jgi:hypothetical protein
MDHQTRASLMSWMDGFTRRFGLAPGTPRRAASYVDRVMSARTLSTTPLSDYELGLLGAAAVFAAAKYEDGSTVSKLNAAGIASYCGFATSKEVIRAEREMLAALRYELGGPTCLLHRHPGQGRRAAGLGDSEAGTSGSGRRRFTSWHLALRRRIPAAAHAVRRGGLSGLLRDMRYFCIIFGVYFYGKSCVSALNHHFKVQTAENLYLPRSKFLCKINLVSEL